MTKLNENQKIQFTSWFFKQVDANGKKSPTVQEILDKVDSLLDTSPKEEETIYTPITDHNDPNRPNNLYGIKISKPTTPREECKHNYPLYLGGLCNRCGDPQQERPKEIRTMGYNDHLDRVLDGTYQDQFNEIIDTLNNLTKHIYK